MADPLDFSPEANHEFGRHRTPRTGCALCIIPTNETETKTMTNTNPEITARIAELEADERTRVPGSDEWNEYADLKNAEAETPPAPEEEEAGLEPKAPAGTAFDPFTRAAERGALMVGIGHDAMLHHPAEPYADTQSAIADAITDLMHYADRIGADFGDALAGGRFVHDDELADPPSSTLPLGRLGSVAYLRAQWDDIKAAGPSEEELAEGYAWGKVKLSTMYGHTKHLSVTAEQAQFILRYLAATTREES